VVSPEAIGRVKKKNVRGKRGKKVVKREKAVTFADEHGIRYGRSQGREMGGGGEKGDQKVRRKGVMVGKVGGNGLLLIL